MTGAVLASKRGSARGTARCPPRPAATARLTAACPPAPRSFPGLGRRQDLRGGLAARLQAAGAWRRARRARCCERALRAMPCRVTAQRRSRAHVLCCACAPRRRTCRCRAMAGGSCASPDAADRACVALALSLPPIAPRRPSLTPHSPRVCSLQEATIPYMVRLNLFALGFQYISTTGKPASREEAPVVVCNHQACAFVRSFLATCPRIGRTAHDDAAACYRAQGFPDIWLFLWRCLPVGVSAAENMRFPVMGDVRALRHAPCPLCSCTCAWQRACCINSVCLTRDTRHDACCASSFAAAQLMMSQQTIFVDREDHNSGAKAATMIVRCDRMGAA